MACLVFHGNSASASVNLGETLRINLTGGKLDAGGPVLASHSNGGWRIGDVPITRITCDGPIRLELQTEFDQRAFGPFTDVVIGANSMWTAQGCFARYNAFKSDWFLDTKTAGEPRAISNGNDLVPA
jgi:hypothetical protein